MAAVFRITIAMKNKHFLVVVADEASAIFYTREKRYSPLRELRSLSNDEARAKIGELLADRGGRSFDSHGEGRHTMTREKAGPKEQVAIAFARQVAEQVADAMRSGECLGFALVAAPRFLGVLRSEIGTLVNAEPYASIDKEVVGSDEAVIEKLLELS
jgi:protein required for attachment to host cells